MLLNKELVLVKVISFLVCGLCAFAFFFFFKDTAPPEISPFPLHASLPISFCPVAGGAAVSVAGARLGAVAISGSPAATSKSRTLVAYALAQLEAGGAAARLVDLATLPADALLGRGVAPQVADALAAVAEARIVVAGDPGDPPPPRRAAQAGL